LRGDFLKKQSVAPVSLGDAQNMSEISKLKDIVLLSEVKNQSSGRKDRGVISPKQKQPFNTNLE